MADASHEQGIESTGGTRGVWTMIALIIAAAFVTYAGTFDGPMIFDDRLTITDNSWIEGLWPPTRWWMHSRPDGPIEGRPVASFTFALNYAIDGYNAQGYRVLNVVVHALCALAMFGFVRRTLILPSMSDAIRRGSTLLAGAATVLWLVHPLSSECVLYLTQRTEAMMTLFAVFTVYASVRAWHARRPTVWVVLAVLSCTLAVATKEVAAITPILVLLYDVVLHRATWRDLLAKRVPLAIGFVWAWVWLALLMTTFPHENTVGFGKGMTGWTYLMNQCEVLIEYLRLAVWPDPLLIDYGFAPPKTLAEVWPQAAVLVALFAATCYGLVKRSAWAYLGAWCFVTLAPTSSFVPLPTEVGAERRMYFPLMALTVMAAVGGAWVMGQVASRAQVSDRARRGAAVAASVVVVGLLFAVTRSRASDYQSEIELLATAVEARPENYRAHANLGVALEADGQFDAALRQYRAAVDAGPDYAHARTLYGSALAASGNTREAIAQLQRAIELAPRTASGYFNLAVTYDRSGQLGLARENYLAALRALPTHSGALINLGILERRTGNAQAAASILALAVRREPDNLAARYHLGRAYESLGRDDDAAVAYAAILERNERYVFARLRLGWMALDAGDINGAAEHLNVAGLLRPGDPQLRAAAAYLMLVQPPTGKRDARGALELAQQVTRSLRQPDARVLRVLALALAANGAIPEAADVVERALPFARDEPRLESILRDDLAAYRDGRLPVD